MNLFKKIIIFISLLLVVGYWSLIIGSVSAIEIDAGFAEPSGVTKDTNIASYIVSIYWFAVGAAVILAVAVIVGGAIYYMTSAGSPDKQNEAKSYITGALWGVVLLLSSYLILNTINPQIVKLDLGEKIKVCAPDESPIKSGCIPRPPTAISRVCTGQPIVVTNPDKTTSSIAEVKGVNCLPACEEGQRACGIGETPEKDECAKCVESVKIFACAKFVFDDCKSPLKAGVDDFEIEVPNCSRGGIFGSCEDGFTFFETVKLKRGARYWRYPYYPKNKDPRRTGRCVVHHYEDVETKTQNGTVTQERALKKTDLRGLALCVRPEE